MKEIILNSLRKNSPNYRNHKALIDDEDAVLVSKYNWCVAQRGNSTYAIAYIKKENGKRGLLYMHQLITGFKQTDHINHNGLDNRRINLREVTRSQNSMNQRKTRGVSKYKGVYWNKSRRKWLAQIQINKKHTYLGLFISETEAAEAYNEKAKELFGEYANLN